MAGWDVTARAWGIRTNDCHTCLPAPWATACGRAQRRADAAGRPVRCLTTMDNLTKLYRIRKTCLEMLKDRGYLVSEVRCPASPPSWRAARPQRRTPPPPDASADSTSITIHMR
eukprot:365802-Chlamydomonas_euryale.AAC.10